MKVISALILVLALIGCAILGVHVAGLHSLFGVYIPYLALVLFLGGFIYRIIIWAKSPVPFRIPTTSGQMKSLPWVKPAKYDNPDTKFGVLVRMALEIFLFRSLFLNTKTDIKEGAKVVHGPNQWLWLGGIVFHYTFLIVILRHMRFFIEPVPSFVILLQDIDGFFEIGVPVLYLSGLLFVLAATYLFLRRVVSPQLRYISLINDYFPLFLILGIGVTGVLLRHFIKTDVVGVKELAMGLVSFSPVASPDLHYLFYIHLFLVCVLLAYFPLSKLMHMGGVFLSPTRNLANNNRAVRHINPWNYDVKVHTYEEYEDEFREKMKGAGIPVDKE